MATGPVNQSKVKEGDKLVVEAEKSLKTNWLKWSPDYDSSSHAFDKAALCYRTAKSFTKAVETYERASDVHYKNNAIFHSGKALEQAANICRDLKNFNEAASYLQRASSMYHESGHGDTAGQVLNKAAKLMESVDPEKAGFYHLQTADLHDVEEKPREVASALRAAVNMYARARRADKMLEVLDRLRKVDEQFSNHTHTYEISAIEMVVHLHNDDTVAAAESLESANRIPGFVESDYGPVLEAMVEHYRRDTEAFNKCCDESIFRVMDNEVAKLVRDLKKLEFTGSQPPTNTESEFQEDEPLNIL